MSWSLDCAETGAVTLRRLGNLGIQLLPALVKSRMAMPSMTTA